MAPPCPLGVRRTCGAWPPNEIKKSRTIPTRKISPALFRVQAHESELHQFNDHAVTIQLLYLATTPFGAVVEAAAKKESAAHPPSLLPSKTCDGQQARLDRLARERLLDDFDAQARLDGETWSQYGEDGASRTRSVAGCCVAR